MMGAGAVSPNGALGGEGDLPLVEKSVSQARWLLMPVFALYGGMMFVGLFFG